MRKLDFYRFKDGITTLNEDEFNKRFFDIDSRLHALEAISDRLDETINSLINLGIERIDDSITPLLDEIRSSKNEIISQLNQELQTFKSLAEEWLEDLEDLYQIYENPVLELSELQQWKSALDPNGDAFIRPDRTKMGSTTISYDTQDRITEINITLPYGTYKLIYTYDSEGNVSSETAKLNATTLWVRTYQYDENYNLTGWTEN